MIGFVPCVSRGSQPGVCDRVGQLRHPLLLGLDVRARDFAHFRRSGQGHGQLEFLPQHLQNFLHSRLSLRGETPQNGSPDLQIDRERITPLKKWATYSQRGNPQEQDNYDLTD